MDISAAKRRGIWQRSHKVKSRKVFPWGTTNVKNAAGGLPMWEAQVGQIHLLPRCLFKPRALGAPLSNEYFCWRNDCRAPQLCVSSLCQSCLWPWLKGLSYFTCFGSQHFCSLLICSLKTLWKKWMLSTERRAHKHKCMPSIHGLPGQEPLLWWFIPFPQPGGRSRTWRNDSLWTNTKEA